MESRGVVIIGLSHFSSLLGTELKGLDGWEIHPAHEIDEARNLIRRHKLRVGLLKLTREYVDEYQHQIEDLLRATPLVEWIGVTEREFLEEASERGLIPGYLHDFHTLPLDPGRLLHSLGHAHGMALARERTGSATETPGGRYGMIGVSPVMQSVFRDIEKVAAVDAPVLLNGESGTGKELAARAIHKLSARSDAPLLAVNCGAIAPELIQSELFGHEKGSFTGAYKRKVGRLEAAHGGTLFLDEVADLPLNLQVNLLRFLQEGTIERVGSTEPIRVDVRVIAATHQNLNVAVQEGRFREDLFYRLNVLQLEMPPLRARKADIEPLARHFFEGLAHQRNHNVRGFSQAALDAMMAHSWPGNVRELINRVCRGAVMCEHRQITPNALGLRALDASAATPTLVDARNAAERQAIQEALQNSNYNVSEAARRLGVARATLYRLVEKYDLQEETPQARAALAALAPLTVNKPDTGRPKQDSTIRRIGGTGG